MSPIRWLISEGSHIPSSAIAVKVPVNMIIVNSSLFIHITNTFHVFADKPWTIPIIKG